MIISKTPFRISLLGGGGADFPSYIKKNSDCVIDWKGVRKPNSKIK